MIKGYFDNPALRPIPRVRVAVYLKTISAEWATIPFLLDTGATATCVHPVDAVSQIGISPTQLVQPGYWPKAETVTGVGGNPIYFVCDAFYAFRQEDSTLHFIDGEIRVAQTTPSNGNLPSLLGWDVLQHFDLALDWREQKIELNPQTPSAILR